jgi:hypothetical protein
MPVRKGLRPKDVVRCAKCGRLIDRANALTGPHGGQYGADCYAKMTHRWAELEERP